MARLLVALAFATIVHATEAGAQLVDAQQARLVCRNWLNLIVDVEGDWAESETPHISRMDQITHHNILLGYCFQIEPAGYVLVPTFKQFSPIKATSQSSSFDPLSEGGFSLMVRENLYEIYQQYTNRYGDPASEQSSSNTSLPLAEKNRQAWKRFLQDENEFQDSLSELDQNEHSRNGPLLTTAWHQGPPYNDFCPIGDDGELCIVGCVATAIAQVMAYHGSPYEGTGHHQYYWTGDGTCGGVPRSSTLAADFSDSYEFDLMPDVCTVNDPQRIKDAVAELCYEVGVSVNMNYGVCASGANTANAQTVLPQYFRYQDTAQLADRSDFDSRSWFHLIKAEIDQSQPLLYSFAMDGGGGHAVVCDGWRLEGGIDQIHLNYGWAGSHTAWYALDDIYSSIDPELEKIVYHIQPGPGETSGVDFESPQLHRLPLSSSPNPFNPMTTIRYSIPEKSAVTLRIFDAAGHLLAVLVDGQEQPAGPHIVDWNGQDENGRAVPSGSYILRVETGLKVGSTKITLVR